MSLGLTIQTSMITINTTKEKIQCQVLPFANLSFRFQLKIKGFSKLYHYPKLHEVPNTPIFNRVFSYHI